MPGSGHVDRSLVVGKDIRQVYDVLDNFRRLPDYAVLRSYDPHVEFKFSGQAYGAVVTVVIVLGLALGYVLSLVLVYVINKQSFGWTIQFHWPVAVLLGSLTIVYIATILAGLFPARLAVRLNPLEVVHEE